MYDEALLKELTELENTVRFDSFDFNDAYALGSALRAAGEKAPKPIAVRIVLDGMILYQSFLPGTDATNNNWMDKKQRTVQLTGTTSLRAAVERELYGAKAPWQHDEEHYAFCGGGAGGAGYAGISGVLPASLPEAEAGCVFQDFSGKSQSGLVCKQAGDEVPAAFY